MTLDGIDLTNVILALAGIAIVCVIWIAANFVLKLTIKVFALGCLGIIVLGAICAVAAFLSGGS